MASAEMVRKTLGHWISIGNYTNSKAFRSLSHWPRCKNNSFQSLLNIDQSNHLEYVRKLFLLPWSDCARVSTQFFSRLLFCVCGSNLATSHCLFCQSATMFRVQLRLEGFYSVCACFSLIFHCFRAISGRHIAALFTL